MAAFYILTFMITWGLGFSYGAVVKRSQRLLLPLVSVASCGPALAGIIISAVINTQPKQGTRKAFWIAFFVAWFVSAVIYSGNFLINSQRKSLFEIGFRFVVVLPVAFVIGAAYSRTPEVKNYLSSLVRLRGVWGWALLALAFYPAMVLLSVTVSRILGMQYIIDLQFPKKGLAMVGWFGFKFLSQFFIYSAPGEEAGWRGFALPRLQNRLSPLTAALLTAFLWVLWHIFMWQGQGQPMLSLQYWIEVTIKYVLTSFVLVWIYNRSKGSILVAGVNHAAINTTNLFFPFRPWTGIYLVWVIIIVVMIFVDRMWEKLPPEHPAVYHAA
jgi:membrane protease YdiL (CAAX protease family)